jgi:putative Mg2+ transporter-C (MgtC) family protein
MLSLSLSLIATRLLLALLCGLILGIERILSRKSAGIRTLALVSMGSALFTIIGILIFHEYHGDDPSRIVAQIISGIGFLGAGVILFQENKVHGVTTATDIWISASIGIACGLGYHAVAAIATLLTLFTLTGLWYLELYIKNHFISKE